MTEISNGGMQQAASLMALIFSGDDAGAVVALDEAEAAGQLRALVSSLPGLMVAVYGPVDAHQAAALFQSLAVAAAAREDEQ